MPARSLNIQAAPAQQAAAATSLAASTSVTAYLAPPVSLPLNPPLTPPYWPAACKHLRRHDPVMRRLMQQYGSEQLQSRGDAFVTLARSIIGQQISVKAAQSVWERFAALCSAVTPQSVQQLAPQALRAAGLSTRKIEYLHNLAQHFVAHDLQNACWHSMNDEAVIARLVAIRGIGRWTAEMFLIFHLMRPNVLPLADIGLQKGISHNYLNGQAVTASNIRAVAQAWQPYCSVATWYVWRSLDPLPVAY